MARRPKKNEEAPEAPTLERTEKKKYVCARWPSLGLRNGIKFRNGYYETDVLENQKIVESNDAFGRGIFRVGEKPKERELTWEEQQERSAITELENNEKSRSRVIRGAVGTGS